MTVQGSVREAFRLSGASLLQRLSPAASNGVVFPRCGDVSRQGADDTAALLQGRQERSYGTRQID